MQLHELWLLRHAAAEAGSPGGEDIDRPLSKQGIHEVLELGTWMLQQGLLPDYVISSPAKRARQTANRVCSQLGIDADAIHYDVRLYLASRRMLLEVLAGMSLSVHRLLLVGHNPGLEDLLSYLCPEPLPRTARGELLNTTNLARIELPDAWKWLRQDVGKLVALTRPEQIDAVS